MMGLLNGQIAEIFAAAFSAVYLDGQLYRPVEFTDDGKGGGGDGGFAAPESVKVQIDAATQAMRATEGFVEGDVRLLMLAHGVPAPDTDCEVSAGSKRYKIATVATDPAGSYYELRGRLA